MFYGDLKSWSFITGLKVCDRARFHTASVESSHVRVLFDIKIRPVVKPYGDSGFFQSSTTDADRLASDLGDTAFLVFQAATARA